MTTDITKLETHHDLMVPKLDKIKTEYCQWLNAMLAKRLCTVVFDHRGNEYVAKRIVVYDDNYYQITFNDFFGNEMKVYKIQYTEFKLYGPSHLPER